MKPEHKKYILENVSTKSVSQMARELGIKERKIRKFLERENIKSGRPAMVKGAPGEDTGLEKKIFQKKTYPKLAEILIFSAIVAIAFLIRWIYLEQIKTNPFFVPFYHGLDDYLYDSWAQSIAAGNVIGKEVFYGLPLYPYFLGFVYFLFGYNVFTAKAIQFFIGSVNCGLVYLIGRKIFNRPIGIIAALALAAFSTDIYLEGFFVSSFLAIFLNCVIILLILSMKEGGSPAKWLITGVVVGLSALANGSVLIFLVLLIFWIYSAFKGMNKGRLASRVAALLAGAVLVVSAVTVRNYAAGKDFVPITAHAGITFYAGNNPLSDGSFYLPRSVGTSVIDSKKNTRVIAERVSGKALKPSEVSRFWFGQGTAFMTKEPVKFLRLTVNKVLLFWNAHEIPDILPMAFFERYAPLLKLPLVSFAAVCPFALVGMFICFRYRRPDIILLYIFIGSVFLSTVIYFVNSRYRLMAVPFLAVFSAAAIYWLYLKIMDRQWRAAGWFLAAIIVLFALTNVRILRFGTEQAHNNLGIILKRQGLYDEAIAEYKKAIELRPDYDSPYFNLGLLYLEQGHYEEAADCFNGALRINPDFVKAHNRIGDAYMKMGRGEEAMFHWERSLELDPDQPDIRRLIE